MSEGRKLRSKGTCHPLDNIFKNEHYRQVLPPAVYAKITNTPTVNCEKIQSLKIEPNADHRLNMKLMKQVVSENCDIKSISNRKYLESESDSCQKKQKKNEQELEHYGEELLNINFLKQIDQFIMQ